jgi:glycosyltransferase involved in cell wall biosynthesis
MKLAIIISSLGIGGAERTATSLANHWAERGVSVYMITLSGRDNRPFFPLDQGVQLIQLGILGQSASMFDAFNANFRRALVLRRSLQRAEPDVVIAFEDRTSILTLVSAWGIAPVIAAERSNPVLRDPGKVWRELRPFLYRAAAAVVVQTEGAARFFNQTKIRVAIIPNPVYPIGIEANNLQRQCRSIVSVGRLVPSKGFDVLLNAFSKVAALHPDWTLCIWGEGPEKQSLRCLSAKLGINNRVEFAGVSPGPEYWTRSGEIFAFASRYEGFPNALAEAMAGGMATVSTSCQWGPDELISDGHNGFMVPVDNSEELARCINRLIADPLLRKRLSIAAPEVVTRFAPHIIFQRWDELVSTITAQ